MEGRANSRLVAAALDWAWPGLARLQLGRAPTTKLLQVTTARVPVSGSLLTGGRTTALSCKEGKRLYRKRSR